MEQKQWKVAALMTAPRYENTHCRNVIEAAIRDAGLKLCVSQGVYYGQCMQGMMEEVIADGCQLILTVDGDSVFNATHVNRLLTVIANTETIDALAAMQPRRSMPHPLFTTGAKDVEKVDIKTDVPFRVQTAHFGLTAIRVDRLQRVTKPWFWSQPGDDGGWTKNSTKLDDDVWFWMQWALHGNSLYVDPGCRIGHCEEMVSHYDEKMQLQCCYPSEWHDMQRRYQQSAEEFERAMSELGTDKFVRRANIGGGINPLPGYEVIDVSNGRQAYPVDEPDCVFDEVRASHILEHFSRADVPKVLAEWVRILKPGGLLKVSVPDAEYIANHPDPRNEAYLFGGQVDEWDFHKSRFSYAKLEAGLIESGLCNIDRWASTDPDCSSMPLSLNLQGRKP